MVSPVLTENFYTGGFLVREAPGTLSRDAGIIANAGTVDLSQQAGLVLSVLNFGTPTITSGANTGNGTLASVLLFTLAKLGSYVVTAKTATVFSVIDPNGIELQDATAGVAYVDGEIGFTITAGGTAFVAGDKFTIAVPVGTGAYAPYTGALPASALLLTLAWVPASGSKKVSVINREAEVNGAELQWDPTVLASGSVATLKATALAQLAAKNIIAR